MISNAPSHPSWLAHKRLGKRGRAANGLMLRGVVLNVYLPGDPRLLKVRNPTDLAAPFVSCDVLVYEPHHTTVLHDVPILRVSAGLVDSEVWQPRATSVDLVKQILVVDGGGPLGAPLPMSKVRDMDGDHVVIGFLGGNLHDPVIMGQLDHPRNVRNPLFADPIKYKYKRVIRGWKIGVTEGGNVSVDGVQASVGAISTTPVPVEAPAVPVAGNVNIALFPLTHINVGLTTAESATKEPTLLGTSFLNQLNLLFAQMILTNALVQTTLTTFGAKLALFGPDAPLAAAATVAALQLDLAQLQAFQSAISLSEIGAAAGAGRPLLAHTLRID